MPTRNLGLNTSSCSSVNPHLAYTPPLGVGQKQIQIDAGNSGLTFAEAVTAKWCGATGQNSTRWIGPNSLRVTGNCKFIQRIKMFQLENWTSPSKEDKCLTTVRDANAQCCHCTAPVPISLPLCGEQAGKFFFGSRKTILCHLKWTCVSKGISVCFFFSHNFKEHDWTWKIQMRLPQWIAQLWFIPMNYSNFAWMFLHQVSWG